jgi:hypothetical protein
MEKNNRTDQSDIAMLYRGMHGRIIFIDKDHNALLENIPKLKCDHIYVGREVSVPGEI